MTLVGQYYCPLEDKLKTADRVVPLHGPLTRAATDPRKHYRCLDCGCRAVVRVDTDDDDEHDVRDADRPDTPTTTP